MEGTKKAALINEKLNKTKFSTKMMKLGILFFSVF